MLGNEGFQHQRFKRLGFESQRFFSVHFGVQLGYIDCVFNVRRKVRPVAQMPPAAHHGQVYAGFTALHFHGQYVDVFVASNLHGLLMQYF